VYLSTMFTSMRRGPNKASFLFRVKSTRFYEETHILKGVFDMKKFVSTMRRGFHMTFENGLTVSVQWGAGNYCDNHNDVDFSCSKDARSDTAEVAVMQGRKFLNANHFLNPEDADWCDEVVGYLSPEQVAELLVSVKNCTAEEINEIIEEDCTY